MNEVWGSLQKYQRQQQARCSARFPTPTKGTCSVYENPSSWDVFSCDEAGLTWRAHITLPEADGAAWGAVASHKPHGSLWYHRCKGNPGFLNLQLGSPWLCPHEWVVWSNPCSHLFHCNLASFTGWLCWAQMKFLSEKKLKRKFRSRDATNAFTSFEITIIYSHNWDWSI